VSPLPLELIDIEYWRDSAARLGSLTDQPWFVLLDSCRSGGADGRFDIATWSPATVILTVGETSSIHGVGAISDTHADPFDLLKPVLHAE